MLSQAKGIRPPQAQNRERFAAAVAEADTPQSRGLGDQGHVQRPLGSTQEGSLAQGLGGSGRGDQLVSDQFAREQHQHAATAQMPGRVDSADAMVESAVIQGGAAEDLTTGDPFSRMAPARSSTTFQFARGADSADATQRQGSPALTHHQQRVTHQHGATHQHGESQRQGAMTHQQQLGDTTQAQHVLASQTAAVASGEAAGRHASGDAEHLRARQVCCASE